VAPQRGPGYSDAGLHLDSSQTVPPRRPRPALGSKNAIRLRNEADSTNEIGSMLSAIQRASSLVI